MRLFIFILLGLFSFQASAQDYFLDSVSGGTITVTKDLSFPLGKQCLFFSDGNYEGVVNTDQWARLCLKEPAKHELLIKAGTRQIPLGTIRQGTDGTWRTVTVTLNSPAIDNVVVLAPTQRSVLVSDFTRHFGEYLAIVPGPNAIVFPQPIEPQQ